MSELKTCLSQKIVSLFLYMDGRTVIVPLAWSPRLFNATPEQRSQWKVCADGYGIHWESIDEDLSTEDFLRGSPAQSEKVLVACINPTLQDRIHALAVKYGKPEVLILNEALEHYLSFNVDEDISCFDLAARAGVIGVAKDLPSDLSTNKSHFEGFGKS